MKQTTLLIALLSLGCGTYSTVINAASNASSTNTTTTTTNNTNTHSSAPSAAMTTPAAFAQASDNSIDCNYVIKGDVHQLKPEIITQWATNAALQTFTFDYKNIETQMDQLKNCYTPEGWKSYYSALQESKNIQTIQQQQLSMTAQSDGNSHLVTNNSASNAPSWEINVPIKVTYKNATKNLSQSLSVKVAIAVINGTLPKFGITQIIATTPAETPAKSNEPTPNPQALSPNH